MRPLSLLSLACLLTACNISGVRGSGVIVEENRPVTAFTALDIAGGYRITVTVGTKPGLHLRGDDNILPLIESKVTQSVLRIRNKKAISPKSPVELTITTASLDGLKISGSASGKVKGVAAKGFILICTGSCRLDLSGTAEIFRVSISGSGKVRAANLKAKSVDVDISGSGRVQVMATETLKARISGSGTIRYGGNPKVERSISGSGSIEKR